MAFKITVFDNEGNFKDFETLDSEVCVLWNVPKDDEFWCSAPDKGYSSDWERFLVHCVMLMRAYCSSGHTYFASDFFKGLLNLGRWRSTLEDIHANRFEIQLLLFWIEQGYQFRVENKW